MSARIAFLGDLLLGGEGHETLERNGYGHAFERIAPALSGSDLVVVNLEGPVTRLDRPVGKADTGRKRYWYRAELDSVAAMRAAGVRVVSLGNNHIMDFGLDGLTETIEALDAAGIAHCGAGMNDEHARRPAIVTVGGCRIGFLSLMQRYDIYVRERLYASHRRAGPARLRLRSVWQELAELKQATDLAVVLVHWGRNYRPVTTRQRRIAETLTAAGVDLVIGHHPHIPHVVDLVNGRPVFYSLGNGPLGTPGRFHSGRPPYGLIATIDIDERAMIDRLEVRLIAVDNTEVRFSPVLLDSDAATRFLRSLVADGGGWTEHAPGVLACSLGPLTWRSTEDSESARPSIQESLRSWDR